MAQELSVVGKRLPQPDAAAKATGVARYAGDIKLPGMLIAKIVRSPYPHAKIKKIDKSKAEKLPGVEAIITPEDIAYAKGFNRGFKDIPMMASGFVQASDEHILNDKARHIGDGVAAVAAVNESIAEEAVELIEVEYEKLPAVFDPEDTMKPGAPQLHDYAERNIAKHTPYPFAEGDVEKGFAESDLVVEGTFRTSKQAHCTMETAAAVASFEPDGKLKVWSQCQLAHLCRREIAHIFGLPIGMVEVINPYSGGSFGQRLSICAEPVAIALAKKTGKPVKLVYSREEDFTALETRTPHKYTIKMGFKKDGTLMAIEERIITDCGGYGARAPMTAAIFMALTMGHYRCPNRAGGADIVLTNNTLGGAFRGFGNPAGMWGVEQMMDMAAEKLEIDPMEIRLKNIKKVGELTQGLPIESTALEECIRIGAERIGWREKRRQKETGVERRGVGMATMSHCSGAAPAFLEHSNAFIKLNEDGSANLTVHPGSPGTGILGTLSQIAAEELGVSYEDVHIVTGNTDITMFDIGSHASRSAYCIGNAVREAARQAKGQLLERAAKTLGVSPNELEVKDRRVYVKAAPDKGLSVAEVAWGAIYDLTGNCLNISGKGSFIQTTYSPPTQAVFAEVEVSTETGVVKILKLVIANDSGIAINLNSVEGQIEGGALQGIGFGLTEDYFTNRDSGVVESDNFDKYRILSPLDLPETEVILVEKPDPKGPFGAKSVGESALVAIAPAIANAIYDAVGVRITDLPVTPEKILKALKEKEKPKTSK